MNSDLDNLHKHRMQFISELNAYVEPVRAGQRLFLDSSVKYGVLTLQQAFILNGGGLIAVPAYFNIFLEEEKLAALATVSSLMSSSLFAAGVIFAGLSGLLAYLNYQYWFQQKEHEGVMRHKEVVANSYPHLADKKFLAERMAAIESHQLKINLTYLSSLACGVLSYSCFIGGCIWLGLIVLGKI